MLTELVEQFHLHQDIALEAHADALEGGITVLGRSLQPLQTVAVACVFQAEIFFDGVVAGQQGSGRARDHIAEWFDGDLIEVGVVQPELAAVTDDHLLIGCVVVPAEFTGPGKCHLPAGLLGDSAILVGNGLDEVRLGRPGAVDKGFQAVDAGGMSNAGESQREQQEQ